MLNRQLIILCIILFGLGVISQPVQYLFPKYVEDTLGSRLWLAGILRAIPIGLGGFSALVAGAVCDQLGRKRTFVAGIIGIFLVGLVFVSSNPAFILAVLCLQGIASGLKSSGGQSYLIGAVDTAALGRASAAYFLSGILGQAFGKSIAGILIQKHGYANFGWLALGSGVLLAIFAVLVLPDQSGTNSINTLAFKRQNWWKTYSTIINRPRIVILAAIRFFSTFSWGSLQFLLPLLMARLTDIQITGFFGGSSDVFACLCLLFTGVVCDRIGVIKPAIGSHLLIFFSLIGLMMVMQSAIGFFVAGVLASGAAWSLSTTMPRFIKQFLANDETGRGVGLVHLAWSTGFLSGYLTASLLVNINLRLPLFLGLVAVSISAFLVFRLSRFDGSC